MAEENNKADESLKSQHDLLEAAQAKGTLAKLGAYTRLSGPGWLQSAITLGGGSLASALFLGILGGPSLLWLQLVAITMGVVMLSAISYVTLTTGERPFGLINRHINPALGWGWIIATCMANIIWCMPQFSLCFAALEQNLVPAITGEKMPSTTGWKLGISVVLLALTGFVLMLNLKGGKPARVFDWFLKGLIGMIVLCFFGVVVYLTLEGLLDWPAIFAGLIPDISQWTNPAGEMKPLIEKITPEAQEFWTDKLVREQRAVMIAAAATAVGINMTFLMPYSLLQRGWGKTFRGLSRFDLATGMAIPYILVTSCVVIASSQAFHGKADDKLLSNDPKVFITSPAYTAKENVIKNLYARVIPDSEIEFKKLPKEEKQAVIAAMAKLPEEEKRIANSLVKRNAFLLSQALAPLLGEKPASLVFGLGVFGMGFSTIIILMMINGFVFCEALGKPRKGGVMVIGCLVAGLAGASWPWFWDGDSKLWLAVLTSSFGMMLLPVAYITFFMLMNSKKVLGDDRPEGMSRLMWNVLMGISVLGALIAAGTAVYDKITDHKNPTAELAGKAVLGVLIVYVLIVIAGFVMKAKEKTTSS